MVITAAVGLISGASKDKENKINDIKKLYKDKEINSYFLGAIDSLSTASHKLLPKSYKFQEKDISDYFEVLPSRVREEFPLLQL